RLGGHRIGEIESIDVGLLNPFLQDVGDCGRGADEDRPHPADSPPCRAFLDGPGPLAAREVLDERMDGVRLLLLDDVGWIETTEVDAAPTRHENERAIVGGGTL